MTDESVNEDYRMKTYISLDIGGTAIKYGLISDSAEIIFKGSTKTEAEKGGPEILKKVIGIVEDLLTRTQDTVSGICISTAGMVDTKEGSIFFCVSVDTKLCRDPVQKNSGRKVSHSV